jgi:hypothetical protein
MSPRLPSPWAIAVAILWALLLSTATASAVITPTQNPIRQPDASRLPAPVPFNLNVQNAGINRADCEDPAVYWEFRLTQATIPTAATYVDFYASPNTTSCTPRTSRGDNSNPSKSCYRVARFDRQSVLNGVPIRIFPVEIIAAFDKKKDLGARDPEAEQANLPEGMSREQVCEKGDMPPSEVVLHIVAIGSDGIEAVLDNAGGAAGGEGGTDYAFRTLYDIGGPAPPTNIAAEAGNNLIALTFTNNAATGGTAIQAFNVYCVPEPAASAVASVAPTTKDLDAGLGTDAGANAPDAPASDSSPAPTNPDTPAEPTSPPATGTGACFAGSPLVSGRTLSAEEAKRYTCGDPIAGTANRATVRDPEKLRNGFVHAIAIAGVDLQGNAGPLSTVVCATPAETDDFYSVYRRNGGQAAGCAIGTGSAPAIPVLAVAVAALARSVARRRRNAR